MAKRTGFHSKQSYCQMKLINCMFVPSLSTFQKGSWWERVRGRRSCFMLSLLTIIGKSGAERSKGKYKYKKKPNVKWLCSLPPVSRALKRQRVTVSIAIIPTPTNLSLAAHQIWILLGDFFRISWFIKPQTTTIIPLYVLLASFLFFIKHKRTLFLGFLWPFLFFTFFSFPSFNWILTKK